MSLTEAGVCTEDALLIVVVQADVKPEVGTGLCVSGIVAVKLTTVVTAGDGGIVVLAVSGVWPRGLIDAADEFGFSEETTDIDVVAAIVLSRLLLSLAGIGGGPDGRVL